MPIQDIKLEMKMYNEYCMSLLRKLISIPSESQNEENIANFLCSWLEDMGMQVKLQHISGKSYNVIAKIRGKGKGKQHKKLLLGGHIDTVSANEHWRTDPYCLKEDGNFLYGLGAGDMKGGIAAQITVLKELFDSNLNFSGEIEFIGLADEERYSIGAHAYVKEKKAADSADFAILAEPHYDNIVIGSRGKALLNLDIRGVTGHAAMPESGINAIDCMALFINILNNEYIPLYKDNKIGSLCILRTFSKYEGYSLSIPEKCTSYLNKQLNFDENVDEFIENIRDLYERHVGKGELTITKEIPFYPSYKINTDTIYLKSLLNIIHNNNNIVPELKINQSVSDGNVLFNELSIPTILYGPQGINYHKENEYVLKDSMLSYMEILEQYILQSL